ncbi:MAG: hypothetical protein K8F25_10910, partial [Fimbriimonadaceae bacterium]|nr:hypothetical protein [Alphaproteobacteria bacterium]
LIVCNPSCFWPSKKTLPFAIKTHFRNSSCIMQAGMYGGSACIMQVDVMETAMSNFIVWFDIPVLDLARAMKFYSIVMSVELTSMEIGHTRQANFPFAPGFSSGSLKESKEGKPTTEGTMVYLNGGEDLSVPLARVETAGGVVIKGKTPIGPNGFMAIFKDTEGNHVALHSRK